MEEIFTPLLAYNDIRTCCSDLISDAFGIDAELGAMFPPGEAIADDPSGDVLSGLFEKISHDAKVQ